MGLVSSWPPCFPSAHSEPVPHALHGAARASLAHGGQEPPGGCGQDALQALRREVCGQPRPPLLICRCHREPPAGGSCCADKVEGQPVQSATMRRHDSATSWARVRAGGRGARESPSSVRSLRAVPVPTGFALPTRPPCARSVLHPMAQPQPQPQPAAAARRRASMSSSPACSSALPPSLALSCPAPCGLGLVRTCTPRWWAGGRRVAYALHMQYMCCATPPAIGVCTAHMLHMQCMCVCGVQGGTRPVKGISDLPMMSPYAGTMIWTYVCV